MMRNIKSAMGRSISKYNKNQLLFLLDGLVINGAYILTTGVVLSGYAISLGAGDFLTALLNNCTNYATILSLLSFIIFEKRPKRKKLLLALNFTSRFLMALIALLPLVFHNNHLIVIILIVLVVMSEIIWGIYRVGWLVWMMSAVPKESKSDYIYLRTFLMRLFMSIMSIISGFVLDMFNKGYIGFLVIFSFSFVLSLLDVFILKNIDETEYTANREMRMNLKIFLQPILSKAYRNFLMFIFLFYLCLTMASSFTPIYLIRYLDLDYKFISTINVISQSVMIISSLYWVRIEKQKGFKSTLGISAFFTAGELFILSFVTKETWPLLFLSCTLAGIGTGGFNNSTFTYRYELMPDTDRTIYEGWYYFAFGLSMLAAPFMGKMVIDYMPTFTNIVFANSKIQLLYLICFILLCLLLLLIFMRPSTKDTSSKTLRF